MSVVLDIGLKFSSTGLETATADSDPRDFLAATLRQFAPTWLLQGDAATGKEKPRARDDPARWRRRSAWLLRATREVQNSSKFISTSRIKKDSVFCFICYLFKKGSGSDAFVVDGWDNWNIGNAALIKHSGSKVHKAAQERYIGFINPKVAIDYHIDKWTDEELRLYKKRLTYSLRCIKFLLFQGLAFRGNDESEESSNRGNFIELLKFLAGNSDEVNKYVLNNAPADESSDISHKEQLALCLRFVDKLGRPCEHFIGVVHVDDTTSLSLKEAIKGLLDSNGLSMTRIRGQGYDGASNMKVLVVVAKGNTDCKTFFDQVSILLNIVGVSCKRHAFSPSKSFASFDAQKLRRLAEFYPNDFSNNNLVQLELQLDNYIDDMKRTECFQGLDNIVDLSVKLIDTNRHKVYDMVYLLLKLVLLLPVATASVERVFSALVIVKTKSRNKLGDIVLDDCLQTFIERDIFFQVDEDDIIETFMSLRKRRINK
ncbi:uncharacterized protein [Miscanthus floridulus]|uniref:uncharacterized protein n=1 Tax=Miscanthus floridulus TaxID=154761 RepID=UPI0034590388